MTGETGVIKSISESETAFYIDLEGSWSFTFQKQYGVRPKIGDLITLYTKNISIIRGVDLNGVRVFYKTNEELDQEHKERCDNYEKEKQETFIRNKDKLDADYESLPKIFQKRIDRFRKNNPTFRVDYESYEIFCCKEAVKIAEALKAEEAIRSFHELPYNSQIQMVPTLSDQHSGNTFEMACKLAYLYVKEPIMVAISHGSLSPLVGSDKYGDHV